MCIYLYICIYICTCIYIFIHVYMCKCRYTYIYTHVYDIYIIQPSFHLSLTSNLILFQNDNFIKVCHARQLQRTATWCQTPYNTLPQSSTYCQIGQFTLHKTTQKKAGKMNYTGLTKALKKYKKSLKIKEGFFLFMFIILCACKIEILVIFLEIPLCLECSLL